MVIGNVGFGKDEMCSYKHTHNGAVHNGSPLHEVTGGEYQKSTHTANFYRIFQKNNLPLNEPHNFILQIIGGPKTNQYPDTHWKYTMYNGFLEGNYRIFRLMKMPKI